MGELSELLFCSLGSYKLADLNLGSIVIRLVVADEARAGLV